MAHRAHSIESEALSLSLERRTRLVLKLLDSIENRPGGDPAHVERAWLEESNRRYEAYLRGEEESIPVDEAFAQLRAEDH